MQLFCEKIRINLFLSLLCDIWAAATEILGDAPSDTLFV